MRLFSCALVAGLATVVSSIDLTSIDNDPYKTEYKTCSAQFLNGGTEGFSYYVKVYDTNGQPGTDYRGPFDKASLRRPPPAGNEIIRQYHKEKIQQSEANLFCQVQNLHAYFGNALFNTDIPKIGNNNQCHPPQDKATKMTDTFYNKCAGWFHTFRDHLKDQKGMNFPYCTSGASSIEEMGGRCVSLVTKLNTFVQDTSRGLKCLCWWYRTNTQISSAKMQIVSNFWKLISNGKARITRNNNGVVTAITCKMFKPVGTPFNKRICKDPTRRRRLLSLSEKLLRTNEKTSVRDGDCPVTNLLDLSNRVDTAGFQFAPVSDKADTTIELFYDSDCKTKVQNVKYSSKDTFEFVCSKELCCKPNAKLWAKVNGKVWEVTKSTKGWEAKEKGSRRRRLLTTSSHSRRRLLTMGSRSRGGSCRL